MSYTLDPAGRTLETISTGKHTSDVISHYDGPGSAPAWLSYTSGEWTREIPGIDGTLTATQTSAGVITLQLHDLEGNTVGTIGIYETETKLLTKYQPTEFGAPQPGSTPPKYSWLAAAGITTEPSTGLVVQNGTTYVPQLGRKLQPPADLAPGAPNNTPTPYTQPGYASTAGIWANISAELIANATKAREAHEAAERPPSGDGEAEEPLGGYEDWACEYAAETDQEASGCLAGGPTYNVECEEACTASVLGEIKRGLNKVGSVVVEGAKDVVKGAEYLGEAEARGAKDAYEHIYRFITHPHTPDAREFVCGAAGLSLLFATTNPFSLTLSATLTVGCAFYG